jgi:hypothetical protein
MNQGHPDGSFSADKMYTMTELAHKLGVSEKWVRMHLVDSGECAYKRRGNSFFFMGSWIITWCMADHEIPSRKPEADPATSDGKKRSTIS